MLTHHTMDSQTQTHGDQDQQNPSGYEPTWPKDLGISPMPAASIFQFITRFFQVSDNPDLTEEWLSFFGEEAKVVMGEKVAEGKDELRVLRKGMWEKVKTRKHTVQKGFPGMFPLTGQLGGGGVKGDGVLNLEFMIYGTVLYTLRETGKEEKMDWAAHGILVRREMQDGEEEMKKEGSGRGSSDGKASARGNTSPFVFGRYRVYLSSGVE
ncbi:hypothetical protein B0T13DRAFT_22209 [Neurospora crassa]|nr:hypothetical protein B0T13DRAFT_22209 [Neurospora crassa]